MSHTPDTVTAFWRLAGSERWFAPDPEFDAAFRDRFVDLHMAAARREHDGWAATGEGALALAILLDQFPRNAYRGTPHMYATDPLARALLRPAVEAGLDREVEQALRGFLHLPFSHSEDLEDQELAVSLSERLGGGWAKFARGHRGIIERFGRFPHRNRIFGRDSTPEELEFLAAGGFGGT